MFTRPKRPRRIVSEDGRWEVIPFVKVYEVHTIEPRVQSEVEMAAQYGKKVRIVYSSEMYDVMVEEAEGLVKSGTPAHRIEPVFAVEQENAAIRKGDFMVVALVTA